MYPYIDEILGVDWIMDINMLDEGYFLDDRGNVIRYLNDQIKQGKHKDPRDKDSTKENREEFLKNIGGSYIRYDVDLSNDMSEEGAKFRMSFLILTAKLKAITPPQGYPNAPTYYIPEDLDELYEAGKLDKLLDPRIPAMYRETFPQELRDKIEWYAKKHNIK